jgi:predicted neutral ceramidase superfamily lipid hydrolase
MNKPHQQAPQRKPLLEKPVPKTIEPESSKSLKYTVFSIAGLISLYCKFSIFAEADIMTEIYKDYDYSFLITVPTYFCSPIAVWLSKHVSKMHMNSRIFLALLGQLFSSFFVPIIALYLPATKANFSLLLLMATVSLTLNNLFQIYFFVLASIYHHKWIGVFFIYQRISLSLS